jgi:hypothetical protein
MMLPFVPIVMASSEHILNQDTVGTHGESSTENPKDVFFHGAVSKHNVAVGTSREGGTHIEDKHGVCRLLG